MKMKKRYTKKQIMESIKYWQKQLKMMNESGEFKDSIFTGAGPGHVGDEKNSFQNKLLQNGALVIDSYESRVNSRGVSDFTVNEEVAKFFKTLAKKMWI